MGYVLGLDLGPSSIGWAAVNIDGNGDYKGLAQISDGKNSIPAIGARIFPAGVDNINQGQREEPKNKKRREARSVRRMLRRRRARRLKLLSALTANKLMPTNDKERQEELNKNPYELRAKAISEKISLYEVGRIFLHIAKRRGFKSNRRQAEKDAEAGLIKEAINRLAQEIGDKTLGQFWAEKRRDNPLEAIRNRRSNYHWIAQRQQYQDELNKIWQKQSAFYPDILTNRLKDLFCEIVFRQINFELSNMKKRRVIGTCTLITGKPRLSMSSRKAQEFRLLQKINDMKVYRKGGEIQFDRQKLYEELMVSNGRDFKQIRKLLGIEEDDRINQEHEKSKKLIGNQIDAMLAGNKFFGKKTWLKLSEQQKEEVWKEIQNYLRNSDMTTEQLVEKFKDVYGLEFGDIKAIEKLAEPKGNLNYCEQAIDKILPYMRQGKNLYEAIEAANFIKGWTQQNFLPLPSKDNGINIPNPIVTTVMFQLRKVINALVREFGKPEKIIIEFARELKVSKDLRKEIIEEQAENQNEREQCAKRIREYHHWDEDVQVSATDILKYRLWEEQNGFCPYSLRKIGIEQLLSTETEVDHILPYSMSLDNSRRNKVICFSSENQTKGQNSPIDWLGETSERFRKIAEAIEKGILGFDKAKKERFFVHNEEIAEKYTPDRLLQDTSYIAREVRSYLKRLYSANDAEKCVKTTKGGITAELRNMWGLNAILRDGEIGPKNRDDLRHHAIDAAVIAITSPGMIKKITDKLRNNWPRRPSRTTVDEPWTGFGQELAKAAEKINISHKVLRKVKGALHKETNYWKETNGEHVGKYITRKELNGDFSWAEQICDEEIKRLAMDRLTEYENDAKKAFAEPLYLPNDKDKQIPIRKVRVWQTSSNMMQLRPNIWVEPGSNHHIEIFETKDKKGKLKYEGKLVSMYEAAQSVKNKQPIVQKNLESDGNFLMSLSQNEMVLLKLDDGSEVLHRTQKMSQSKESISIIFRPHTYGGKLSDYDKPPLIQRRSPSTLSGRKVIVDPLGRIRWAND
ncbi:MAG: type II CRISPR RNA-guided endonuclease Cas9 [Phycisphaerae bacterium]|nr:type II CRISPR RNA-guided endonuclease Cas9 [Phycisphaerae bacterium]